MTTQEYLCRHFARMGARVVVRGPRLRQRTKIAIDVGRDRSGEVFVIGCEEEVAIEVLDVQPKSHHLVLMTRDGSEKHKFLLGRDERHWFAATVPGDGVRDVRTAIAGLRPTEIGGSEAIRQGEWFFVSESGVNDKDAVVPSNEPLSRGAGSKPHVCEQMMRKGGEVAMVSRAYRHSRIQVSWRDHLSFGLEVAHIDFIGKISRLSIALALFLKPNSKPAPGVVGISVTI